MHMLRKKDLSSDEMDTLRRSRIPTTVVTANGEKCQHTRKHKFTSTILISSRQCKYSMARLPSCHQESSVKTTEIPMSGSEVKKATVDQTRGEQSIYAKRKMWYLWSFLDCRVHLPHRHRRTRQVHHRVHRQVQPRSEVTSSHQETGRGIPQGIQRIRMTVCEIFQNGWRSSQIISKIQKCLHPHAFLMPQIRNVLRKWYQNQGSTVYLHTLPKRPKL